MDKFKPARPVPEDVRNGHVERPEGVRGTSQPRTASAEPALEWPGLAQGPYLDALAARLGVKRGRKLWVLRETDAALRRRLLGLLRTSTSARQDRGPGR